MSPHPPAHYTHLVDFFALVHLLQPDNRVLVGISGGADSVALLLALAQYTTPRLRIHACHVNHRLRPESDTEETFVRQLCQHHTIPCTVIRLTPTHKPSGLSPEQWWRTQRYAAFETVFNQTQSQYLALGHTANDLAETFLFHLTRGTGIHGLTFNFLKQSGNLPIIRPLWKTTRTRIEDALNCWSQPYCTDSSNENTQLSRNKIRHHVLPALAEINPQVVEAILAASQQISRLNRQVQLQPLTSTPTTSPQNNYLSLHPLHPLSQPEIADHLRPFIHANTAAPATRQQTHQAVHMIATRTTGLVSLVHSKTLVIHQTHAWVIPIDQPNNPQLAAAHPVSMPTATITSPLLLTSDTPLTISSLSNTHWSITLPANHPPVQLRNRQPGDRIRSKSLKKLLIQHQIPWYFRDYLILVVSPENQIIGIIGEWGTLNKALNQAPLSQSPILFTRQ